MQMFIRAINKEILLTVIY